MRSIKNKIEQISTDVSEINEILTSFIEYDEIPLIDIDLLKSKIRIIYEDVNNINDISAIYIEEKRMEEPIIKQELPQENVTNIQVEDEIKIEDIIEIEKVVESKSELVIEEKTEVQLISVSSSVVANILKEFKQSNDLASQLQFKPINDINNAVSINDRIGFVNDIFSGNNDDYANCITRLNSASDIDNAVNILNENSIWDFDNPVHRTFIELVYRKFL